MIKVGILSMQRIANYGSFLQAYGLKQILEELGCEVQFVDYHPGNTLIPPDGGTGYRRRLSKVIEALMYNAPMKEKIRYIRHKKNYSFKYFPYLGITEKKNYKPELDLLIIGSDEVFNCIQNNTNVGFSPELFGVGHNAKRLVTYAASFGNTTIEKLVQYGVKDKVGMWLKEFDALSVRDKNSGRVVETLVGLSPVYHFDPVLAYDFIGKCTAISDCVTEESYMILYGYAGRFSKEECHHIKSFARNKGLKVFCIGGVQDVCDKFIDCSPFEVIAYFQNAKYVVTDTFHGTILSVIANRKFVSVIRNSGYGNSEKLTDLLERLNLPNRILLDFNNISYQIEEEIDYSSVNELIEKERKNSINYLNLEVKKCIQN